MYIGNTVQNQGFTPQVDFFSGNASTTAFTLSRPVASVYQMVVVVANVIQNPGSAYTVSSNTITFSSAPPTGTNNIWVEYTSLITQVIAPSPGTVGTSQLQSNLMLGGTTTASTITSAASTNLSLQTNNGTTAVTIDTAQNVGIGVTPGTWTSVAGKSLQINNAGNSLWANGIGGLTMSVNAYYNSGWFYQNNGLAARYDCGNANGTHTWGLAGSGTAGGVLTWTTGMTLDASGNLSNTGYISSGTYIKAATYLWAAGTGAAGGVYLGAGSANGCISQASQGTGTVTTYIGSQSITTVSDSRLKENVVDTTIKAVDTLNKLRVVDHTWNDPSDQCENNRNSRGTWVGLIAQEAKPIIPWLVNKPTEDVDKDGNPQYWHMDYGYSVPLLIKAIQELSAQVTTLQTQVTALQTKVGV